ncbi:hypothetical protein P691DRAFT_788132 [Macrolepiota fuliginosa MF-IS2]|uniref:Glycan binding protein Y3-like domain-containing protein n=1 Tax=Macrolepiota fuliginosa MF-IS2 TaxID=1400762 RepID=A0A9P5X2N1_9AGAR|nr:hypothetical protein P691DRAFT_788132 [Macrolepiota fuliginosa MF-IS2]
MLIKIVFLASLLAISLGKSAPPITCNSAGACLASDCCEFIDTFCDAVDPENLPLHDSNSRCYNLSNGNRCDFMAFNTYKTNWSPSGTNCKTVLRNVTSQCSFGGHGKITNADPAYTFVVDVNAGPCNINI